MQSMMLQLFSLIFLVVRMVGSYNILAVFPSLGRSHHIVGSALFTGLAGRGHNVTVISAYPRKASLENYHDIDNPCTRNYMSQLMENLMIFQNCSATYMKMATSLLGINITNCTLSLPSIRLLINSTAKFDAVIYEAFEFDAFVGFGHHFKAPVIGFSTFGASSFTTRLVGSPSPLSYVPDPFMSYTDRMTFWQRCHTVLDAAFANFYESWFVGPSQEKIYQKAFPDPKPPLHQLVLNISLVLVNSHFSLGYPRPYVANMIEVGGLQVKRKPDPLPVDLQEFLDSAKDGVIYFSMGTNIIFKDLSLEKRQAVLNVFGNLKQKVLWKFEDEKLPGKPSNLLIKKWFPQDDILSHPNLKLFISHGGLLSTTESVYHGVPILGIPMFGDQFQNIKQVVQVGYGILLEYSKLTEETFSAAIQEILGNKKYSENARKISARYRDQPKTPLETAIFWVEYVIRHKGAPHMRSAGQDLNFIRYHNLDVFALIAFISLLVLYVSFQLSTRSITLLKGYYCQDRSKNKMS